MPTPKLSVVANPQAGQSNQAALLSPQIDDSDLTLLRFATLLHNSLETASVIDVFAREVKNALGLDKVLYAGEFEQVDEQNLQSRHHCRYNLTHTGKNLGEIVLTRNKRFSESELKQIESYLVLLLPPLLNAVRYQEAIDAAHSDPLTGLQNRAAMNKAFSREIQIAQRSQAPLSLLVLDIDFFKKINDNYGHHAGDCVLKTVASSLKQCMRSSDLVYRYGGEEFTVLLHDTPMNGALQVAERIRETLENTPCICHGEVINITASIGVGEYRSGESEEALFKRTDDALYFAKKSGRNNVCAQ